MSIYEFLICTKNVDPRTAGYLRDAHVLGFKQLNTIWVKDLYFIEGQLSQEDLQQLAIKLLKDPVTQSASWIELPDDGSPMGTPLSLPETATVILEVALCPGVTDPVAEQMVRAAHELGLHGVQRAATGQQHVLQFDPSVYPLQNPL